MNRAADRRSRAFRPGTAANHKRYKKTYVAFCLRYGIDDLDPTPKLLSAYIEFLLNSGISPNTVPNYMSGVRHYLQAAGIRDDVMKSLM